MSALRRAPARFLGIAGIAGSGQRELLEAIAGLQHIDSGEIIYNNPKTGAADNLRDKTPLQIRDLGVRLSFVPEDRLGMGLVGNMDIVDNMMLRSYRRGKGVFLERREPRELADRIIDQLKVVTPGTSTPVRRLSGGNVQKVLVGREIAAAPTVLMAAYPVRGLDINSSYTIYNLLTEQKESGVAVIFCRRGFGRPYRAVRPHYGHRRRKNHGYSGRPPHHKGRDRSAYDKNGRRTDK